MSQTGESRPFAERLRSVMDQRTLRIKDVAAATGVSEETVSRWLSGKRHPSRQRLRRLSAFTGYPVSHFLEEAGPAVIDVLAITEAKADALPRVLLRRVESVLSEVRDFLYASGGP